MITVPCQAYCILYKRPMRASICIRLRAFGDLFQGQVQDVLETIKFLFRFEPKQTKTQSVLVVFQLVFPKPKYIFFGLFRCFGLVSKQPKQTELCRNKAKKSPKNVLYQGVLKTVNFLVWNRNKPKLNLFWLFFGLFFRETNTFFRFVLVFRNGIETTETNRTYGMGN